MRLLLRLLRAPEVFFILPLLWVIGFSWPLFVAPGTFSSAGLMFFLALLWIVIVWVLFLTGRAHAGDDPDPGEDT